MNTNNFKYTIFYVILAVVGFLGGCIVQPLGHEYSLIREDNLSVVEIVNSSGEEHQEFMISIDTDMDVPAKWSDESGVFGGTYYPKLCVDGTAVFTYTTHAGIHGLNPSSVRRVVDGIGNHPIVTYGTNGTYTMTVGVTNEMSWLPLGTFLNRGDTIRVRVDLCNATRCITGVEKVMVVQ